MEPRVAKAIKRFIALEGEYEGVAREAREQMRALSGCEPECVAIVKFADIDRALRLYEDGVLSGEQLNDWASILEMSDYVEYECGAEKDVAGFLFRLSTPEINEPITRDAVRSMRVTINKLMR